MALDSFVCRVLQKDLRIGLSEAGNQRSEWRIGRSDRRNGEPPIYLL